MSLMRRTQRIEGCQAVLGYDFNDSDLLWEALQAAGSPVFAVGRRFLPDGNKRLAILGDAVLKLILIRDGYVHDESRGTGATIAALVEKLMCDPGIMNRNVSTVGSNTNLDSVGRRNGLNSFVEGNPSQQGVVPPNTMAATVEAILGAVFLDSGLESVAEVMETLGLVPA
ncbi:hypothetical protein W97_03835 [Coniosporium apollinis CBS 100218]|uniref:RNase III domain-containing protein n=1 Tax=Coniosporium apollinis (strain CBS 100218) TaxID=1168221 RepID=R7YRS2_CONA1|nr:uncharacterized protein W97_03835 [Coniosporium apollinis CBS 100218]EON64602.1 hypothetical protein W97_03835 [Coniosporium apollinis CBS 100218]